MKKETAALLLTFLASTSVQSATLPVLEVKVEGLRWTRESFVLRELLLKPGEPFSEKKLKESVRNLLNTHLFYRVEPLVIRRKNGVIVVLKVKEKFPLVPLPRFRFKANGSYRAGMEVRDYNLFGLGHKIFAGYLKWFRTDNESYRYYIYLNLYRIIENRFNLFGGATYSSEREDYIVNSKKEGEYRVKKREFLIGTLIYLDRQKINQLSLSLRPVFSNYSSILQDRKIYYGELSYTRNLSTDMVYYQVGSRFNITASYSLPGVSELSTGEVTASYSNSVKYGKYRTRIYSGGFGTKVGYSGGGYQLQAPIPGYRAERITGKRYLFGSFSVRRPIVDRSIYLKPTVIAGDAFRWTPDDLLVSAGVELTAFWVKLADGMIRFKLFRGLGRGGETKTSFRLTFRW